MGAAMPTCRSTKLIFLKGNEDINLLFILVNGNPPLSHSIILNNIRKKNVCELFYHMPAIASVMQIYLLSFFIDASSGNLQTFVWLVSL